MQIFENNLCFSFETIECSGGKENLILFGGFYYNQTSIEDLKKLIEVAQNTINIHSTVSEFIENENKKIHSEFYKNINLSIDTEDKKIKDGFIYIAKCNIYNYYKIGMSVKSVSGRIAQLKTANPTLELIKTIKVKNILIEKEIHEIYSKKKIRGEWFQLNTEELEDIYSFINVRNNEI